MNWIARGIRFAFVVVVTSLPATALGQADIPLGQRLIGPDFPVDNPVLDPIAKAFGEAHQVGTIRAWMTFFDLSNDLTNPYVRLADLAMQVPGDSIQAGALPFQAFDLLAPLAEAGDPVAQYYFGRTHHMRTEPQP